MDRRKFFQVAGATALGTVVPVPNVLTVETTLAEVFEHVPGLKSFLTINGQSVELIDAQLLDWQTD